MSFLLTRLSLRLNPGVRCHAAFLITGWRVRGSRWALSVRPGPGLRLLEAARSAQGGISRRNPRWMRAGVSWLGFRCRSQDRRSVLANVTELLICLRISQLNRCVAVARIIGFRVIYVRVGPPHKRFKLSVFWLIKSKTQPFSDGLFHVEDVQPEAGVLEACPFGTPGH